MQIPPYFTRDVRFLIFQSESFTYLINVANWKIHLRIEGFPIGISKDDQFLLIGQSSINGTQVSAYQIENAKKHSLNDIDSNAFELNQRLYFYQYIEGERSKIAFQPPEISISSYRVHPKYIVFRDSFDSANTRQFEIGTGAAGTGVSESMNVGRGVFKTLASPFIAFSGLWDTDWGGYDFIWVGNLDSLDYVHTSNMMANAPMKINYCSLSKRVLLIAGDGIEMLDTTKSYDKQKQQGETVVILKGQHYNTHSVWRGKTKIVDAVVNPLDSRRVIIAERDNWYQMRSNSKATIWLAEKANTIEPEIRSLAYFPDAQSLVVVTNHELRLYEIASRKLLQSLAIY